MHVDFHGFFVQLCCFLSRSADRTWPRCILEIEIFRTKSLERFSYCMYWASSPWTSPLCSQASVAFWPWSKWNCKKISNILAFDFYFLTLISFNWLIENILRNVTSADSQFRIGIVLPEISDFAELPIFHFTLIYSFFTNQKSSRIVCIGHINDRTTKA